MTVLAKHFEDAHTFIMSEHYSSNGPEFSNEQESPFFISGESGDIDLRGIHDVVQSLKDLPHNEYQEIIRMNEIMLPPYVTEVSLAAYQKEQPENIPQLVGRIEFDPLLVQDSDNWIAEVLDETEQELAQTYIVNCAPHDVHAQYFRRPGNPHTMRLHPVSDIETCAIEITSETVTNLDRHAGEAIPIWESQADLSSDIHHVAHMLGTSLDALMYLFAERGIDNRYLMTLLSEERKRRIGSSAVEAGELVSITSMPEREKLPNRNRPTFETIGGAFAVKERLGEIAETFGDQETVRMYGLTPRNFMLYGPPGTGKTSLVEAFASENNADLITISVSDISDSYVGKSAKNIDNALGAVKRSGKKSVVFFDEIDALIGDQIRGSNQTEAKRTLQTNMTDLKKNYPNILVAAATNADSAQLDQAFLRSGRLETIEVGVPGQEERHDIWQTTLFHEYSSMGNITLGMSEHGEVIETGFSPYVNPSEYDYEALTRVTDGWTGADIHAALEKARSRCAKLYQERQHDKPPQVTNELLLDIIQYFNR